VGPTAYLQVLGDPFQARRGLHSYPRGQPHFAFIPFARLAQGARVPSQTTHLLPQASQRLALLRFPPFRPIVRGPQATRRRGQQFLPKLLSAQASSPFHRLEFPARLFPVSGFGLPGKFTAHLARHRQSVPKGPTLSTSLNSEY
jgi:hypothetical protein